MRIVRMVSLFGLAVGAALVMAPSVRAQTSGNAELGKTLFVRRSCAGCHSIGKGKRAGPDLLGVTARRSKEWLVSWLKSPENMIATDSTGKGLYQSKEWSGFPKMPTVKLSEAEISALLAYLEQEDAKPRS